MASDSMAPDPALSAPRASTRAPIISANTDFASASAPGRPSADSSIARPEVNWLAPRA
jgi:hypothetical protein